MTIVNESRSRLRTQRKHCFVIADSVEQMKEHHEWKASVLIPSHFMSVPKGVLWLLVGRLTWDLKQVEMLLS